MSKEMKLSMRKNRSENKNENTESKVVSEDCITENNSVNKMTVKENNNKSPIMISSSIQAELDNDYGKSKKAGEDLILKYGKDNKVKTFVYRFPNVFGKWCRPNYNSVIATWCYNISHDLEIQVNDPAKELTLVYIDDVCK